MLFECQATEAARARYRDALGLGACDMRCLMDKVYQQKDVGLVMDFVYDEISSMTGQEHGQVYTNRYIAATGVTLLVSWLGCVSCY